MRGDSTWSLSRLDGALVSATEGESWRESPPPMKQERKERVSWTRWGGRRQETSRFRALGSGRQNRCRAGHVVLRITLPVRGGVGCRHRSRCPTWRPNCIDPCKRESFGDWNLRFCSFSGKRKPSEFEKQKRKKEIRRRKRFPSRIKKLIPSVPRNSRF